MSWILPGKLKPRPGALSPWVALTPEGKVPVKLTLPGTSPSGFTGPSHPCDNCLGLPLTPECKVPIRQGETVLIPTCAIAVTFTPDVMPGKTGHPLTLVTSCIK